MRRTTVVLGSVLFVVPIAFLPTACSSVTCDETLTCANGDDGGTTEGGETGADGGVDGTAHDGGGDGGADSGDGHVSDGPTESGVDCDSSTALICGGECVDPTDPAHCGSCTTSCPAVTHGTATCTEEDGGAYACGTHCGTGYHECGTACLADSDDPSVTTDPCVVSETFGVFVSVSTGSDTSGAGTRTAPYQTIGHALAAAHAGGKRVYACAGTYSENVVVGTALDGASVYGGLDCTGWAYATTNVVTVAPPSGYALEVDSLTTGATFEDITFTSAAATAPGGSSIAVFAKSSQNVVLRRAAITAGLGLLGQDQSQPAPFSAAAPIGNNGTSTGGGNLVANSACSSSFGGAGGQPGTGGGDGSDGAPGASNKGTIAGCQMTISLGGGAGAPGGPGSTGAGAATWATFSSGGWVPTAGAAGGSGGVGQGGGGGASVDASGGGGSGGAGGCGGAGGSAGTGGGSSIAVLAYASTVDLETCTLAAGDAGRGGNGAAGQTGQTGGGKGGGFGGAACAGGKGGTGGIGGYGGGGAGGLSAGIVWSGTAPTINGTSTASASVLSGVTTGTAGAGGTGAATAQNGEDGVAAAVVQFP